MITLYHDLPSDCSARLRIALNFKGLHYSLERVLLVNGQATPQNYKTINPSLTVPALVVEPGNGETIVITQSVGALEYLEDAFPDAKALLPPLSQPNARADVRSLMNIVALDIHPLTTTRVHRTIPDIFNGVTRSSEDKATHDKWDAYWITRGLQVYENELNRTAGKCSVGDEVTLADVCLVPELWTAQMRGINLASFPRIHKIYTRLMLLHAFSQSYAV